MHYRAGELQLDEWARAAAHIRQCPSCNAALDEWADWEVQMKKEFTTIAPPPSLQENLLAALKEQGLMKQETGDIRWFQFAGRTLALTFAAFTALLLGIWIYLYIIFGPEPAGVAFRELFGAGWSRGMLTISQWTGQGKRALLGNLADLIPLTALVLSWLMLTGLGLYHNLSHWEKSH